MYCIRCGAHNDEGTLFCTECGWSLEEEGSREESVGGMAGERTVVIRNLDDGPGIDPIPAQHPIPNAANAKLRSKAPYVAIALVGISLSILVALVVIDPAGLLRGDEAKVGSGAATKSGSISGEVQVGGTGSVSANDSISDSGNTTAGKVNVEESEDRPFAGKTEVVGNLINGGYVSTDDDGTLYYASPVDGTEWHTNSIVRCSSDASNKKTLYRASSSVERLYHINVIGDKVVFNQVIEGSCTVMSMGTDGYDRTTIDSCDDYSLCQVDNGWVYYLKSGRVCRCDLDGNSRSGLANVGQGTLWRVAGEKLFTQSKEDAKEVYVSELDGSKRSSVHQSSSGYEIRNSFPIDEDTLIVWEGRSSGKGTRIFAVDLSSSKTRELWSASEDIERLCAYPEGVIVTQKDSAGSYVVFNIEFDTGRAGSGRVATSNGEANYTSYLDGRIYYGVTKGDGRDSCSLCYMPLSGGEARYIEM